MPEHGCEHFAQLAAGGEPASAHGLHQIERWLVGNEVARELEREVVRGRRVQCEIEQHRLALFLPGDCMTFAEQRARAWLVCLLAEAKTRRFIARDCTHAPAEK